MIPAGRQNSFMRIFFTLLLSVLIFQAAAQSGILKGTVLEAPSKAAIIGADIFVLQEKSKGTTTDEKGNFSLELSTGTQTLVCTYLGYATDTFNVMITAGQVSFYNVLLKPDTKELSTVVVSAGKYEQHIEDITVSMEVLKPKLIESKNTTNITQALEQVPGLNILDEEPQIRGGSGFAFGVGSRVATMIDGIPILRGDIGKPDWNFIPIENLDQVEVIKGASSVLYGSSALSGVINFFTKYPTQPSETKVRMYSGIYSSPKNPEAKWWNGLANFSGLNLSQGWKTKQLDLVLGAQLLYDHNFIGPPVLDPTIGFSQDTLSNKDVANRNGRFNFNFRYRPQKIDRLSLGVNGNLQREQSNFSLVWGNDSSQLYRAFPGTIRFADDLEYYVDPFITYFTASGFRHTLKSRFYSDLNVTPGEQRTYSNVIYAEYQLYKEFSSLRGLHLTSGALLNHSNVFDDLYSAQGTMKNHLHNYAAYVQLDKKFKKVLNVSLGFRGEYFSINNSENIVKPIFRAGMNLRLAKATFLRASYGEGFRYPTIAEKFIRTTVGGLIVFPNPDLKPETSWNSELGIKQAFKLGKWYGFLDGAAFWQEFFNTIEYNYALWEPDSAGFKFVNTGNTRVRGLDFSLVGDGKIAPNVSLSFLGGYTYTLPQSVDPHYVYAKENPGEGFIPRDLNYIITSSDTTNYILKYRFQHIAKMDAEVTYKLFTAGISERYYSFMKNIDKTFYDLDHAGALPTGIISYREDHNKGTWVTDARVSYTLAKHYKVALVVNNLFNAEYSLRPVKADPMRTIAIQLRADL